jgi:hypothetical protein
MSPGSPAAHVGADSLVNDYKPSAYLTMAAPAAPVSIMGALTTETDVVLTRASGHGK